MTERQKTQFNYMRGILVRIGKKYASPDKLRRTAESEYGLRFDEALEMSYENIQEEARAAVKGVKAIK